MEEIEKFDSYRDGYNMTIGGEGAVQRLDYSTRCMIYELFNRYEGISREIGRQLNVDHTLILNIKNNPIYANNFNEEELQKFIQKLKSSDKNLKENYQPHNNKKLNENQIYEILSIVLFYYGYDKTIAELFNVDSKCIYRLKHNLIYKEYCNNFNNWSYEEKEKLSKKTFEKYNLEERKYNRLHKIKNNPYIF